MGEPRRRNNLQVTEIFVSLQGEGGRQGLPTTFIRLGGCRLHCAWCDTDIAHERGETLSVPEVVAAVKNSGGNRVCVTGGEPLEQSGAQELFTQLSRLGVDLSVETNGTIEIAGFTDVPSFTVDYKLPSARTETPFAASNWAALRTNDELKFIVADRQDYQRALRVLQEHEPTAEVLMSPCLESCRPTSEEVDALPFIRGPAKDLAEWIIEDKLPVRYSLQLQKLLGIR